MVVVVVVVMVMMVIVVVVVVVVHRCGRCGHNRTNERQSMSIVCVCVWWRGGGAGGMEGCV